jgi:prolyl-tRNA synthetase
MMQDKKALQAGTSHNLASNFAKAFDTKFLDKDGKQKLVHQTSWGVSTRLVGGVIMTHSDDKGLVLPPKLAGTHLVILPVLGKAANPAQILEKCDQLAAEIKGSNEARKLPYSISVLIDKDDTKQMGWKFHEYELLGIPLRMELGARDLEKGTIVLTRRDTGEKMFVPFAEVATKVATLLAEIQKGLLEKARAYRDQNTFKIDSYADFSQRIEKEGGFYVAPWCESRECEEKVKQETKATIRCLPLQSNYQPFEEGGACLVCQTKSKPRVRAIFARSY